MLTLRGEPDDELLSQTLIARLDLIHTRLSEIQKNTSNEYILIVKMDKIQRQMKVCQG